MKKAYHLGRPEIMNALVHSANVKSAVIQVSSEPDPPGWLALTYPNEQSLRNLIAKPGIINCGLSRREKAAALNASSFTETTAAETEQEHRVTDHRRCSHRSLACSRVQFAFASAVLVLYSNNLVASTIRTILGI
jgi:hypothetical protein